MNQINIFLTTTFLLLSINLFSQSNDKQKVEKVIINSYIHGLIDGEDFEKAKEGIHEDFVIWGHQDSLLTKKTRDDWISQRKKRTNLPKVTYTIFYIDIEGDAANAKIEMTRENSIAVDYIFLYRFKENWRIVSAIDHVKRSVKE